MKTNKKESILIADSCAGGFGVLKYFLEWAGDYNIYYLADGEENPFGKKTKKEVKKIVCDWIKNFKRFSPNLKLVVVACNTASISIKDDRKAIEKEFNVSLVTMIDGTKSSIEKGKNSLKGKNNLIIGTRLTIDSKIYSELIENTSPLKVYQLIGEKTEKFVAKNLKNNIQAKKEMLIELNKYCKNRIDTILLGCTCYEFIKKELKSIYGKNTVFINPAKEVSEESKKILDYKKKKVNIKDAIIYTTGELDSWKRNLNHVSQKIFNKRLDIKKISLKR